MSSEIAYKSISLNNGNISSYNLGVDDSVCYVPNGNYAICIDSSNYHYMRLGTTGAGLYPNNVARPTKIDITIQHERNGFTLVGGTAHALVKIGGETICDFGAGGSKSTNSGSYNSGAVTGSTRATEWQLGGYSTHAKCGIYYINITTYFMRYDFSAVAGSGVTSASVSSSTGYGGADIAFSCVIPTGYVFDGWYKAGAQTPYSTDQSFTYTIPTDNAANYDLTLTAKAHQSTHSVNGTYNGSTKAILTGISGDVAVSYNGKSKTLNASSASHTLSCSGKVMRGNVSVGSASLATGGKIMRSDLALNYV